MHPNPASLDPECLRGGIAVVIDLIRASTTIVYALGHGAVAMIPCESLEDALLEKQRCAGRLAGGERGGLKPRDFDLGNSPSEYTGDHVRGRIIAFTTTNGTRAMRRSALAHRLLVGSFANLNAVVEYVLAPQNCDRAVHIVCAGVNDGPSHEDTLCAGAFVRALMLARPEYDFDTIACAAAAEWDDHGSTMTRLRQALEGSPGGQNLSLVGLLGDLPAILAWDAHAVVPALDSASSVLLNFRRPGPPPRVFLPCPG